MVLHPNDAQQLYLEKLTGGDYIYGGPEEKGPPTVWGVPLIESAVLTEGPGLVGSFAQGCVLFDREQPRIDWSEQHSTLFASNQVIARGEERIAFAVTRPSAFASLTGF